MNPVYAITSHTEISYGEQIGFLIEVIVNLDLSKMYNWSTEWPVDFNPKKTECIIFSTNQAANKLFFGLKSTGHSVDQLYILDKSKLTITSISFILLEEYNNDVSSANSLDSINWIHNLRRHFVCKVSAVEIVSCWNIGYYISNRYERVSIQNCLPEQGNLKGGVPQWSVLAHLLFLLYINDIADNTQSLSRYNTSVFFGLMSTGHSVDQLFILDKSKLTITSISFILLEEYNNDVSSANSLDKL
jgi:hypothetical protein